MQNFTILPYNVSVEMRRLTKEQKEEMIDNLFKGPIEFDNYIQLTWIQSNK